MKFIVDELPFEVYVENNKAIKELKSSAINASVYRWWLYFGK